ncbi:MAG: SUMF1/EgtB/PvdO family nonheme iron enzyme [Anaerolineales bacterium]|nr:SUMF1/EgtB/PvdO family nonheme iron enzyme [Anaerolineales bacterium]
MSIITLDMIVGSIVEMGVQAPLEAAYDKAKRTETVIKILKRFGISHEPERDDFEGMYRFALVEWGVFKPAAVVSFFRDQTVQDTFANGFRKNEFSGWLAQTEGAYEAYLDKQGAVEYDPRRELEAFLAVFHAIVDRTDTPAGMRRTQSLDSLHEKIDTILLPFTQLPSQQDFAEKLLPYLEMTARQTGRLPLGPLDPSGRENTQLALDAVFINLNAEVWQSVTVVSAKPRKMQHTRYSAALGHIQRERRLILLGDPGSGKSTLLRYLAFCLVQAKLDPDRPWLQRLAWVQEETISDEPEFETAWQKALQTRSLRTGKEQEPEIQEVTSYWGLGALVPLLVELRDFAQTAFVATSPTAIWEFVAQRLRESHLEEAVEVLRWQAQRGRVFFLLDGVDEVPIRERPRVWQAIAAMEQGVYGGNRWVATCRKLSFEAGGAPANAAVHTLQGLTDDQVQQFVASWYNALVVLGEMSAGQAKVKVESLQTAARRPRLRELAENPMLLTIMTIVQTYYGTLPDERAKLYQQCVETLLLRWQRHKELHGVTELPSPLAELETTQEKLERLLWEIAWEAHSGAAEREDAADMPETRVMAIASKHLGGWGKAEAFVKYTEERAHLLLGRGGGEEKMFAFPHRTFQEYLAACHLAFVGRGLGRRAAELAAEGDTWREVLNLVAGTLTFNGKKSGDVMDVVEKMLPNSVPAVDDVAAWRRVWLGAEMALVPGVDFMQQDEVGQEILPWLQTLLAALVTNGALTPPQRAAAGMALGRLGDDRADVAVDVPEMVPVAAGTFLLGSDKTKDELAYDDEMPQHELWLPDYAIGKYPVTVAQFGRFVAAGGYTARWQHCWTTAGWQWREANSVTEPRYWQNANLSVPNQPVVGVSWYEAVAYCGWLRATTGRAFRLPSEAMWEKAASWVPQVGSESAGVKRLYPWGDEWDPGRLNGAETRIGQITAVGLFPTGCSFYGTYDMAGNVWEWCSGAGVGASPYPFELKVYDEEIATETQFRALRGAAAHNDYRFCRAAFRGLDDPDLRGVNVGFRVAEHLSDSGF